MFALIIKKKGSVSTEKLKSLLTKHYFTDSITSYIKLVLTVYDCWTQILNCRLQSVEYCPAYL